MAAVFSMDDFDTEEDVAKSPETKKRAPYICISGIHLPDFNYPDKGPLVFEGQLPRRKIDIHVIVDAPRGGEVARDKVIHCATHTSEDGLRIFLLQLMIAYLFAKKDRIAQVTVKYDAKYNKEAMDVFNMIPRDMTREMLKINPPKDKSFLPPHLPPAPKTDGNRFGEDVVEAFSFNVKPYLERKSGESLANGIRIVVSAIHFIRSAFKSPCIRWAETVTEVLVALNRLLKHNHADADVRKSRQTFSRKLLEQNQDFVVDCAAQAVRAQRSDNLERPQAPVRVPNEADMLYNMALVAGECNVDEEIVMRNAVLAWQLDPGIPGYEDMASLWVREMKSSAGTMDRVCAMCRGTAVMPPAFEYHTSSMDCGHVFHTQCCIPWKYILKKKCPVCHD
ncbi:hypothetical protein E4U42_000376 [Claviceps africana]|uniref:RING-type domain-containing protein n=1 Tax=Claviceps africana TaxID=83212 RepID=A0A8K0J0N1_9HYPO|nr:hypothetical protein E4U42_000376 [Claviceps africana]